MPPRFDSSKPFPKIKAIAAAWGWRGLEMWQHTFEHDGSTVVVTWYSTSHPQFYLQINEHPVGNADAYAAGVYAVRYGIPRVGIASSLTTNGRSSRWPRG